MGYESNDLTCLCGSKLELTIMNIHDVCEPGGHYGILMGNLRRKGTTTTCPVSAERLAPGKLVDEIIKNAAQLCQ